MRILRKWPLKKWKNLNQYYENEKKLKIFLLPKDEADKRMLLLIRAGTGGLKQAYLPQSFQNVKR